MRAHADQLTSCTGCGATTPQRDYYSVSHTSGLSKTLEIHKPNSNDYQAFNAREIYN